MLHEEKKVAKIVEELSMFFFSIGSDTMSSSIKKKDNEVEIIFKSNYCLEFEHSIQHLEESLNEPKNEGMEDIYWQLAGSGDPGEASQLLLIGMMIDHFEMMKENGQIELRLYKKWVES